MVNIFVCDFEMLVQPSGLDKLMTISPYLTIKTTLFNFFARDITIRAPKVNIFIRHERG